MADPLQIHLRDDVELHGALVIVGAPGLGFVGSIATRFLVESLQMERIGGLHSEDFPPYAPIEAGRPLHPVRFHHKATACGLDLKCERIVVVTSELVPNPRMSYRLADTLTRWAQDIEAELVLVPDAVTFSDDEAASDGTPPGLQGVATTDRAFEFLGRADVPPLGQGALGGLTASLLAATEQRGQDMAALLAASQPDHPDARAAARVVEVLDRVLPGIEVRHEPLLKRAEEIETKMQASRRQLQPADGAPRPDLSMYH